MTIYNSEIKVTNIKRFYVPGIVIREKCPRCDTINEFDLGDDYLSYPEQNDTIEFFCYSCDECFLVNRRLTVNVTIETGNSY